MKKVLNYFNNNLNGEITLANIASAANMNPTAFCRYIRSNTTKTFIELLNDIRISNARRLLLDTKRNISEISYQCGF
jgi:AraC-like DNA-binding protein